MIEVDEQVFKLDYRIRPILFVIGIMIYIEAFYLFILSGALLIITGN